MHYPLTDGVTGRQQLQSGLVAQQRVLQLILLVACAASRLLRSCRLHGARCTAESPTHHFSGSARTAKQQVAANLTEANVRSTSRCCKDDLTLFSKARGCCMKRQVMLSIKDQQEPERRL